MAPRDEDAVDKIFSGCLENLPPLSSKVVRIFTSSTFTDMLMERNTLMEWVYPKIKVSSDEFLKCHNTLFTIGVLQGEARPGVPGGGHAMGCQVNC